MFRTVINAITPQWYFFQKEISEGDWKRILKGSKLKSTQKVEVSIYMINSQSLLGNVWNKQVWRFEYFMSECQELV